MKRINLKDVAERALLATARSYLGFTLRTTRWRIAGPSESETLLTQSADRPVDGCITASWHHTILMLPALCRWGQKRTPGLSIKVMISRNKDGRFINDLVAKWNIVGVEGSSDRNGKNKGGSRALRQACAELRDGAIFAITPDGPRGPAQIAQPGVEALMRLSRKPLVPIGATSTAVRLPTWDRLRVPLPFGRGYLLYGAARHEPASSQTITDDLDRLTRRAEHALFLGRARVSDWIWQGLGFILMPALRAMMLLRLRRGKERRDRLPERRGRSRLPRPPGTLLWLHAASVGEVHSILPLIDALALRHPSRHFLLTTATLGGADIVAAHLGHRPALQARLIHQFIPYDVPLWTKRFLDHWRPCALLLTDSELWPGLILSCVRRAMPVGVLNGRLSATSWRRWRRVRRFVPPLFRRLDFVAARGEEDAAHFRALGAGDVVCYGDLKQNAPPPAADARELTALRRIIGDRPVFLAASTHAGEDEIILRAAAQARRALPGLLTIIAPRHPVRGAAITALVQRPAPMRSKGETPGPTDTLWVADTLGELGLFYRLASCAFIGNSLVAPGGGHNPFEPVRLDVILATGPHQDNFQPAFAQLEGLVSTIGSETELAGWIEAVITEPGTWRARARTARDAIETDRPLPSALIDRIDALCD